MALTTNEETLVRQLIEQNAELLNLATNEATIISKLAATKKNLGQLTSASSVSGTDISFVRQGTADKSATLDMLRGYMAQDQATETTAGVVELATVAEVAAGTDSSRAVTPAGLSARTATETRTGVVELATTAEVQAGTDTTRAVTPAGLSKVIRKQIQSITTSVASNALTLGLAPTTLDFRSGELTSGAVNTRTISAALSLAVPPGATLGTVNAVAARLAILAIDNVGTIELAVANLSGGVNLDETTLISTTAISASATSASVIYSTTARTNVPFRVVGFVYITQATAGTWATAPAMVQGVGGQALAALSSLGYGQTWQDVTPSRVRGTTYYNTTGRPIFITISQNNGGNAVSGTFTVDGRGQAIYGHTGTTNFHAVVPLGSSYYLTGTNVYYWHELR